MARRPRSEPPEIPDDAALITEALLQDLIDYIKDEYTIAAEEMQEKLNDYLMRFKKKDETWRKAVENGTKTQEEYIEWRTNQILVSKRYQDMLNVLTRDAVLADAKAMSIIKGYLPEAYAINFDFATYQIESGGMLSTSFTLYDRPTVERLWKENPKLLPDPSPKSEAARRIREEKDFAWNKGHINEQIRQGIIQGEDITQISERLQTVATMDENAAIRNARTMMTSAQNAGRIDGNERANKMGIETTLEWCSTLDGRTRSSHRHLHGERITSGGVFSNGLHYPGDPEGEPSEIYNCRCTLLTWVKGFEPSDKVKSSPKMGDMTFEEWLEATPKSNKITLPKEKAQAIKNSYIAKYKHMAAAGDEE